MNRIQMFFVVVFALIGTHVYAVENSNPPQDGLAGPQSKPDGVKRVGDLYPLTVDPLGDSLVEINKPIIILYEGRELRFASNANLEKFKKEPAKYLGELDKKVIAQQTPLYPLKTCLVSGDELGGMGDSVNIIRGNRLVRFCCEGCIDEFKKDPDKYLARINEAVIKAQKTDYPLDTCVVSGEKLGSMGDPVDYVIGNRLVRFCCTGCVKMFEKNPAKFLAKLEQQTKQEKDEHANAPRHDNS